MGLIGFHCVWHTTHVTKTVFCHCGLLCVCLCDFRCQMHMSRVFDHIEGDCWRKKVRNNSARATLIGRLVLVFPLPQMFNVVLHKTVAEWGQTKDVNCATPIPSRACQHWIWGVRGLTYLLACVFVAVWCLRLVFYSCCELISVNRRNYLCHFVVLHVPCCRCGSNSLRVVSVCVVLGCIGNATHCAHVVGWKTHCARHARAWLHPVTHCGAVGPWAVHDHEAARARGDALPSSAACCVSWGVGNEGMC